MPQFKFCFHLESKMSAAAPASSLPWSGPSPHCMRLRRTPPPSFCAFTWVLYLMIWVFFFSPPDKSFSTLFLSIIYHAFFYDLFELEMVCIVWEVCVFAHLPSFRMLSDDCSRLLVIYAPIEYSRFLLCQHQHKAWCNDMFSDCTTQHRSSHVGQTDSNPSDAAKLLTSSQNFKKVCPALCHRSHQESGRCDQFKV